MRRGWSVLVIGALLACLPAPASAAPLERAEQVSRIDHLTAELRRDPVYVTDHAPRAVPEDAAQRIKKAVARLGVPAYVAVTPARLADGYGTEDLVPLLHDDLGRPGVYIVADPTSSSFSAVQYGGATLPVQDAVWATWSELPSDAGAVAMVERFVEIALSGHAEERRERAGPRPKSKVRIALDARDRSEREASRAEWRAFAGGTTLSGAALLLLLVLYRRRTARAKTAQAGKTQAGKTHARKAQAEKMRGKTARPGSAAQRKKRGKRR
ncbi:hypothetical protein [Actinomadura chokoriensis]|uniref:TPM domain-containing protein n=1 Tax=Actinomadura chokoriensis TaxID=454156 RepID=A0ABV4R6E8_9ACTN